MEAIWRNLIILICCFVVVLFETGKFNLNDNDYLAGPSAGFYVDILEYLLKKKAGILIKIETFLNNSISIADVNKASSLDGQTAVHKGKIKYFLCLNFEKIPFIQISCLLWSNQLYLYII